MSPGPEVSHHFQPTMDNSSENFFVGNCSKHPQHFQIPPTTFCSLRVTTKNLSSALFYSQKTFPQTQESRWAGELKMQLLLPPIHGFYLCSSFHITIFCLDTRISWVLLMKFPSFCSCLSKSCITLLLSWSQDPKATTLICDSWPSCGCCLWWSGKILLIFACISREKHLKGCGTQETCSTCLFMPCLLLCSMTPCQMHAKSSLNSNLSLAQGIAKLEWPCIIK